MRRTLIAGAALAASLAVTPAPGQEAAGWPRQALLDEISRLVGKPVTPEPTTDTLRTIDPTEDASCFSAPGDTTVMVRTGVGSVLLVGDAERVYSLEFYYPIVNMSAEDRAEDYYTGIFRYLFPGWEAAGTWPFDSLIASWNATGRAMIDPTVSVDETIARHTDGSVKLATYGVPPDIVLYRVTARPECEKVSPYLLASPRKLLKDEARRNLDQSGGGLLLSYLHPVPVDMSATPWFIGTSSTYPRKPGTLVAFETPPVSIEIGPWMDRQVQDERYASTSAALEYAWGYTSFFPHLVADPRLPVEIDGQPGAALIEKVNTDVRKWPDHFTYEPSEVVASFFTATPPAATPPLPPPDSFGYGGEGALLVYSTARTPVDIAATPIHLGRMHLYRGGQSGDKPGYYATAADGLGFTVEDRTSGEATRVDLSPWLAANPIAGPVTSEQYMTDPVIRFQFGGKPHILVLEGIQVIRTDDGGGTLDYMTGQLFRAP